MSPEKIDNESLVGGNTYHLVSEKQLQFWLDHYTVYTIM